MLALGNINDYELDELLDAALATTAIRLESHPFESNSDVSEFTRLLLIERVITIAQYWKLTAITLNSYSAIAEYAKTLNQILDGKENFTQYPLLDLSGLYNSLRKYKVQFDMNPLAESFLQLYHLESETLVHNDNVYIHTYKDSFVNKMDAKTVQHVVIYSCEDWSELQHLQINASQTLVLVENSVDGKYWISLNGKKTYEYDSSTCELKLV